MNRNSDSLSGRHTDKDIQVRNLRKEGLEHSKAGRFDEAMKCFQLALEKNPKDADALHLSGLVLVSQGKFNNAKSLIRKAIKLKPGVAVFHFNLAKALLDEGNTAEAIESYLDALRLQPSDTNIIKNLNSICDKRFNEALEWYKAENFNDAESACRQILDICPHRADAWHLWGLIANAKNDTKTGIERIHRAIAITPNEALFHNSLGTILGKEGKHEFASACFKRAIELDEKSIDAHMNLAMALRTLGILEPAIDSLNKIVTLDPDNFMAYVRLASALELIGNHEEAITTARKAVELAPNDPRTHGQLGLILRSNGLNSEAIEACQRSIKLDPNIEDSLNTLGALYKDQGNIEEALDSFRKALDMNPSRADIHSNVLFSLHYSDTHKGKAIFKEHLNWARCHNNPVSISTPLASSNHDPNKRLRIGYVSADFRSHSVSCFFEPLLAAHDRNSFGVTIYSNNLKNDSTTKRMRQLADNWRDIKILDDNHAGSLIRSDSIDILIDLSGHTGGNRIPLFTQKPAPIQVTYLGYPDTTGIKEMDYRLTDEWADPIGQTEKFYTETLIRLPGCFLCYQPPLSYPDVKPPPMQENKRITFGSFNNLAKVSPTVIHYWAKILTKVPTSRLLLKDKSFKDIKTRERIVAEFHIHGITPDRIDLHQRTPNLHDHLLVYNDVDIALDTYPYHGTTTTCEALWMGVPVITLVGPLHVSRVGVSLLHSVGLSEMIADNPEDYVQKAVELANNKKQLKELRSSLRGLLKSSPLTDAKRITSSIEAAYRQMWREYCSSGK